MKQVICTNAKNYALTEGIEYTAVESDDKPNYYTVTNDKGRNQSYHSSLFEDVVEVVPDTGAQIANSMTIRRTDSNYIVEFTCDDTRSSLRLYLLSQSNSNISCGIHQLSGLNTLAQTLSTSKDDIRRIVGNDREEPVIERLYSILLDNIVRGGSDVAFLIMSTNLNDDNFSHLEPLLNDASENFSDEINPNSDNQIRFWLINKAQFIAE